MHLLSQESEGPEGGEKRMGARSSGRESSITKAKLV